MRALGPNAKNNKRYRSFSICEVLYEKNSVATSLFTGVTYTLAQRIAESEALFDAGNNDKHTCEVHMYAERISYTILSWENTHTWHRINHI